MADKLAIKATNTNPGGNTPTENQTGNISLGGDGTYGTVTPAQEGTTSASTSTGTFPPSCAQLLATAQADVTSAQGCVTTIQNAAIAVQPIAVYAQSLIQQATSGNPQGTQAQLAAAQAVAHIMQTFLTAIGQASTQAGGFSANATQAYNQAFTEHCANVGTISGLQAQASSAAASASTANNGMLMYALLAQGILDITHPGPQTVPGAFGSPVPPVPPVSFNPKISFADGESVLQMKIDESDTQSLLTFLKGQEKGGTAQALAGSIASTLISALTSFLSTGAVSPMALVGGLFTFLLTEEATLLFNAVTAADNKSQGVTFNFGLETLAVLWASAYITTYISVAAAFAICDANLGKETSTPGGCGSQVDGFWITSN
jgi:hypothetical protein